MYRSGTYRVPVWGRYLPDPVSLVPSIKIGHVKIFRNGLTVMTGFSNDFRDSFPLLVIELSDRMDLVHCKHTPFLLECCPQRHFKDT